MKVNSYNKEGNRAGAVEVPERVFGVPWNPTLVWQVAEAERANKRRGTAHTKGRADVRGGGIKPWRQKGTGRARHGSIRSPIWIGGGVTHGPTKEKKYTEKVNKKMKKKALWNVLSQKLRDNEILIVDGFSVEQPKTKEAVHLLKTLSRIKGFETMGVGASTLILTPASETLHTRAFRNIPGIKIMETRNMNLLDTLASRYVIFAKESISKIISHS